MADSRNPHSRDQVFSIIKRLSRADDTGCYLWQGNRTPKGYGYIRYDGKMRSVHRFVYQYMFGPHLRGLHVLHKCDRPNCVNPDHLHLGTIQQNNYEKAIRDRGYGKLNNDQAKRLKEFAKNSQMSQKLIGKLFGVSGSTVSRILNGVRRPYLDDCQIGG